MSKCKQVLDEVQLKKGKEKRGNCNIFFYQFLHLCKWNSIFKILVN